MNNRTWLPWLIIFVPLSIIILCGLCVTGSAVLSLYLLRPTPNPAVESSPFSTQTLTPLAASTTTPTEIKGKPSPTIQPDPDSWRMMGDANAPVVVDEFADYQCPYCKRFYTRFETRLREEYIETGKVLFIFRSLPVVDSFIPDGNESRMASLGALCAGEQGKYWDYHDLLFDNQAGENAGAYAAPQLQSFAMDLGLNEDSFTVCLDTERYEYLLAADLKLADEYGIRSVPAFLVNGEVMQSYEPDDLFDTLDIILADSG